MNRLNCNWVVAMVVIAWGASSACAQDAMFIDANGRIGIGTNTPSGFDQFATVEHIVVQVRDQFGNTVPSDQTVRQPGGPYSVDSFFDVFVELAPGGNWAVDSFFDITYRIDLQSAPGGPPVVLQSPSGSFAVDSFFDIFYEIDLSSSPPPGQHQVHLEGQLHPELRLLDLSISNNNWAVDSFFDITYRIGPVGDPPLLDGAAPVLSMRMTSQVVPEPASATLVCLGGLVLLRRRRG